MAILLIECFFTDLPGVLDMLGLNHRTASHGTVIALIQAQMLGRLVRRHRPTHDNRLNGVPQQSGVGDVGAGLDDTQRITVGLGGQTSLRAILCASGAVWTDIVAPKRALPVAPPAFCHGQLAALNSLQLSTSMAQIRSRTPFSTHR